MVFLVFIINFIMVDFSLLTDSFNLDNIVNAFYEQYNKINYVFDI